MYDNGGYTYTLSVMRQVRYSLLSPTTITLLRNGISLLILSSICTGWIFLQLDVLIMSESEWKRMVEWKGIRKGSEGKMGERRRGKKKREGEGGCVWLNVVDPKAFPLLSEIIY